MIALTLLKLSASYFASAAAVRPSNPKTLVLLNDLQDKAKFTNFFDSLVHRRHRLVFKSISDEAVELESYGKPLYNNVVILDAKVEDFGGFELSDLENFVETHAGNVLVAVDKDAGHAIRQFIRTCGFTLPPKGFEVIDHFAYESISNNLVDGVVDGDSGTNTIHAIVRGGKTVLPQSSTADSKVLFKGVNLIFKKATRIVSGTPFAVMRALRTTYSANPEKSVMSVESQNTGKRMVLVGGLQAMNNARVIIAGSYAMFENAYTRNNKAFLSSTSAWNFHETGVLRAHSAHHQLVKRDDFVVPQNASKHHFLSHGYRVNDAIMYSIVMEEYVYLENSWIPFTADDLKLEILLVDIVRQIKLNHMGKGQYTTTFSLPEKPGVYKLQVTYNRSPSMTVVDNIQMITVRPKRTHEYDTFVQLCYPYFLSIVVLQMGWCLFGINFWNSINL